MKKAILLVYFAFSSLAFAQTPVLACYDVLAIVDVDRNDQPIYQASQTSLEVTASVDGKRGFISTMTSPQGTYVDRDVSVGFSTLSAVSDLAEMMAMMLPQVNQAEVSRVRVANIGVEANQQDGGGAAIFELLDKKDQSLGKLVQIGWAFGKCSR